VPKPTPVGIKSLNWAVKRFTANLQPTGEDDIYDLAKRHGGAKAARYTRAADDVTLMGLTAQDASIKMFVKAERFNAGAKVNPDPRAIQFRAPRYCVCLSMYLHPIEEQIYQYSKASMGVPYSRNVAKGLNSIDRAELLILKATHFRNPVYITLDARRFDKHVTKPLLRAEHRVYLHCNRSLIFAKLLRMQLINKCFTTLGIKYIVDGRRMSGDMNTASGNCLIMLLMLLAVMHLLNITKWDVLDDGDDFVTILEAEDVDRFCAEVSETFLHFGMEMKVDPPARTIHDVDFCQAHVVEYFPGRFKFVRDFRNVISKSTSGVRNWADPSYRTRTIHAIGLCELILNLGIPILQEYALCLLRNSSGSKDDTRHAPDGLYARAVRDARHMGISDFTKVQPQEIHQCARNTFAIAFGISELHQLELERKLRCWKFSNSAPMLHGVEWEVFSWTGALSMSELYSL